VTGRGKPGNKADRDRLRANMLDKNCTVEQIATEMASRWNLRPRQAYRYALDLTQDDVAGRYNALIGEMNAPMTGKRISDYEAWPIGGVRPSLYAIVILAEIYQTKPINLVDFNDYEHMPSRDLAALRAGIDDNGHDIGTVARSPLLPIVNEFVVTDSYPKAVEEDLQSLVKRVAAQSRHHAGEAEMTNIGEMTLEELDNDVRRITKEHLYINSVSLFGETVRLRDRVYKLLEGRQYPRQSAQLYFLASVLCALLSDTSASVGAPAAAIEQLRSAFAYAQIIGHDGLRLWSRGSMEASLAFWAERPRRALDLINASEQWASSSIGRVQLHNCRALYSASLGYQSEASQELGLATDARDAGNGSDELFDSIGGMFSYPQAKQSQVATITYLKLGDHRQATREAAQALDLYESAPDDQRAFGNEASARIDLARTYILNRELEGARESLGPVFNLPPIQRQEWFILRLRELQPELSRPPFVRSPQAVELIERVEDYCTYTVKKELPGTALSEGL
jgi:transcriptional regulator with XRE-family HTH domain